MGSSRKIKSGYDKYRLLFRMSCYKGGDIGSLMEDGVESFLSSWKRLVQVNVLKDAGDTHRLKRGKRRYICLHFEWGTK